MPDEIKVKLSVQLDSASMSAVRSQVQSQLSKINVGSTNSSLSGGAKAFDEIGKAADKSGERVKAFGQQVSFTATRLGAYYIVAGTFFKIEQAIASAGEAVVQIDRQVNRLTQIFNGNKAAANSLTDQIIKFGQAYGQSARDVLKIADTLAQAGDKFGGSAEGVAKAAQQIAKTNLVATFGKLEDTTEGLVAILNQFNLTADDTTKVLDLANGLAKKFAFESSDMFEAVKAGGGAFALVDGDLKHFAATVTALRSITRLSASSIGTALNTISVRNLKEDVVAFEDSLTGGKIRNANGSLKGLTDRFIEIAKATKNFNDEQLGPVLEKISDTRQAKFLIPLIRDIQKGAGVSQFLQALDETKKVAGSFDKDVAIGLKRIDVQLASVGAKFEEVFKAVADDDGIKRLIDDFTTLAKASADSLKFILPIIPALIKIGTAAAVLKGAFSGIGLIRGDNGAAKQAASVAYAKSQLAQSEGAKVYSAPNSLKVQRQNIKAYLKDNAITSIAELRAADPTYSSSRSSAVRVPNFAGQIGANRGIPIQNVIGASQAGSVNNTGAVSLSPIYSAGFPFKLSAGAAFPGRLQKQQEAEATRDFNVTNANKALSGALKLGNETEKFQGRGSFGFFGLKDKPQSAGLGFAAAAEAASINRVKGNLRTPALQPLSAREAFLQYGNSVIPLSDENKLPKAGLNFNALRNVAQNLTPGTVKPTYGVAGDSRYTQQFLASQYTPDIRQNRVRNAINEKLGTGFQRQLALQELKDVNPQIRQNRSITTGIDNSLLGVGGQRQKLALKMAKLGNQLDIDIDQFRKGGPNNARLNRSIIQRSAALDALNAQDKVLITEEKALLQAKEELAASTRLLAEVQLKEAALSGNKVAGKTLSAVTGIQTPGFMSKAGGVLNTGFGLVGAGARGLGGFLKQNSGLAIGAGGILGSLALDKGSEFFNGRIKSDISSSLGDKLGNQKELDKFFSENKFNQTAGGALGGASTGLSYASGIAGGLAATGVGIPAALAVLAGGALIGGISGAVGGGSRARENRQKELLGALSQAQTGTQRATLRDNFLRSLNKEGGFRGGGGGFKFTGNPNSFTTPIFSGDKEEGLFSKSLNVATFGASGIARDLKNTFFPSESKLFQDEFAGKLRNTQEGQTAVEQFKQQALDLSRTIVDPKQNFSGQLREKLINQQVQDAKEAAASNGKTFGKKEEREARANAALDVSEKLRAAGLATDGAGTALDAVRKNALEMAKNISDSSTRLQDFGPSITNFISTLNDKSKTLNANTGFGQAITGLQNQAVSGIFGNTQSINTQGFAEAFIEKLKSDITNSANTGEAGNIASSRLSGILGSGDAAVFGDIAKIQRGLGGLNKEILQGFGGKTFENTDLVESALQRILPGALERQGINATTGEGKDLLTKLQKDFETTLESPDGRKAFEQDRQGFIDSFLKKFGAGLDDAGNAVKASFAALQAEIDRNNASFQQFREIQQKVFANQQAQFDASFSRTKESSVVGASSSQISGGLSKLLGQTDVGILSGSTFGKLQTDITNRQGQLADARNRLAASPEDQNLIREVNSSQNRLIESQDLYNKATQDTTNVMAILRARIEETNKQFASLNQSISTAGGKNQSEFSTDRFKLNQFSGQFGGLSQRLKAAGIETADQFSALSEADKKKLAGNIGGLAGSQQALDLLGTAGQYGGTNLAGGIGTGETVEVIKRIFGEKNLGGLQGFDNAGAQASALGKFRNGDFALLGSLQQRQLDTQSNINNAVLAIYQKLIEGSKNPEDARRLKELQAGSPEAAVGGPQGQAPVGTGAANNAPLIASLERLQNAITSATGKETKINFDGTVKIAGLETAGRDKAIGQVVTAILDQFVKQLDRSDPTESQLAEKLQNAIKAITGNK